MPLLIHKTAPDNNPFYFNFVYILVHSLLLAALLLLARGYLITDCLPNGAPRLTDPRLWGSYFAKEKTTTKGANPSIRIATLDPWSPVSWMKAPITWIFVSSFEFAFFAWATNFTETAVVSTIYELWPAIVVYWLIRLKTDRSLLSKPKGSVGHDRSESNQRTNGSYGACRHRFGIHGR